VLTVQTDEYDTQDVEKKDAVEHVSSRLKGLSNVNTYRQNTDLTTRGIFLVGFSVSPAVMPRLSVPPSTPR
jgi:hypothetical protein